MNRDFMPIRDLEGHLLLSIKKPDFGITVSTSELVYHKPHTNYYLSLRDMVSIVPFTPPATRGISIGNYNDQSSEYALSYQEGQAYRIHVTSAVMHNRSGRFQMGAMQFVLPLPPRMLQLIGQYSGMSSL